MTDLVVARWACEFDIVAADYMYYNVWKAVYDRPCAVIIRKLCRPYTVL